MKKDTAKWCEFNKSTTHNTNECRAKQSLAVKLKALELDLCSKYELETNKEKKIIDAKPNYIISTTKVKRIEPKDLEEGEHLFHLNMCVKGLLL